MGGILLQIIIFLLFVSGSIFIVLRFIRNKKKREIIEKEKQTNDLLRYSDLVVNANIDFKSRFSFYLSAISKKDFSDWKKSNKDIFDKIHGYDIEKLLEGQNLNEFTEFALAYSKGWDIIEKFNNDFYNFNKERVSQPVVTPVVKPKKTTVKRKTTVVKPKEPVISYPNLKENWKQFEKIIEENRIYKLYHFTDEQNLESIIKNKGLYSWNDCLNKNIEIIKPGGNQLSRDLDRRSGLENYVRLSFNRNHPMMYVAKRDGRISNPIILEISTDIVYLESTKFSNINATSNSAIVGANLQNLKNINFQVAKSSIPYYNLADNHKPYFQAEVLVKNFIPISNIININTYNA